MGGRPRGSTCPFKPLKKVGGNHRCAENRPMIDAWSIGAAFANHWRGRARYHVIGKTWSDYLPDYQVTTVFYRRQECEPTEKQQTQDLIPCSLCQGGCRLHGGDRLEQTAGAEGVGRNGQASNPQLCLYRQDARGPATSGIVNGTMRLNEGAPALNVASARPA